MIGFGYLFSCVFPKRSCAGSVAVGGCRLEMESQGKSLGHWEPAFRGDPVSPVSLASCCKMWWFFPPQVSHILTISRISLDRNQTKANWSWTNFSGQTQEVNKTFFFIKLDCLRYFIMVMKHWPIHNSAQLSIRSMTESKQGCSTDQESWRLLYNSSTQLQTWVDGYGGRQTFSSAKFLELRSARWVSE